jgi:hypothetical protein
VEVAVTTQHLVNLVELVVEEQVLVVQHLPL